MLIKENLGILYILGVWIEDGGPWVCKVKK